MTARFVDTMKAIKEGLKLTPAQAVKNIEVWEDHVATLETTGAKTLHADLGSLKKCLQKEPIDGMAVTKLLGKLAADTIKMAGHAEGKRAEQVEELGQALEEASKIKA